ncbi:MAG: corrinoid protein [Spirochaetaceae bacterium]|nr:MAG: corrinoid protein [Spirochaetaceae bacterium]
MSSDNGSKEQDKQLLTALQEAILSYEEEEALSVAEKIVASKVDPLRIMNTTIADVARLVGEKYESGEIFLPHLVMAGDIMSKVSDILESSLPSGESAKLGGNTVVIGTVESDIHSIGKSIVAMLLKANGFKVFDLGVDVKSEQFIKEAESQNANILAMSSLLTTTLLYQKEVIEDLDRLNLRKKYKVLIGGGPVTKKWADEINADGYGKDAIDGVEVAKSMVIH